MPHTDPTKRAEYMRKYRAENHERVRARDRVTEAAWREKNKPRLLEKEKAYRNANRDALREKWKAWALKDRAAHPEKHRQFALKRLYGITQEEYDRLLLTQDGHCAICPRKPEDEKFGVLHVDHSHTTGAVRGLLCHKCNTGGGLFNDDPDLLCKAADWFSH